MAHASGGVEIYSQDRGHAWPNRIDTWRDPRDPSFPDQLGGGFAYVATNGEILSTRFEDLPVAEATTRQTRRFGMAYYETVTDYGETVVRHRVLAPEDDARALVAEVTVENRSGAAATFGVVEVLDPNLHEIPAELVTSDLLGSGITADIDRRRRAIAAGFTQTVAWDAIARIATVTTQAKVLPGSVVDPRSVSAVDYFPAPVYLAVLDADATPDAVWLIDREIWGDDPVRPVPAAIAEVGDAAPRSLSLDGEGQRAFLAVRVPVEVPPGEERTVRFALGYAPDGANAEEDVTRLRISPDGHFDRSREAWRERLVYAALPGLPRAGAMQRELAWASYNAIANVTYDSYYGTRVLGQGGSYKFIHGLDGAMGDLCLFADAMLFVDPTIARDTLRYALSTQRGPGSAPDDVPGRYPYATTGVGAYSDVVVYDQRSDVYWTVPSSVGRYVAATRDFPFLDERVAFWPRSSGDDGTVVDHLRETLRYANEELGVGARGLVAMGTGDYADGVLNLSSEDTTPTGSSSTYNALLVALGLPVAADVVASRDASLATELRALVVSQVSALESEGWAGDRYHRGFVDSGNPLAPGLMFLEPQVLPILAGLTDAPRRDALLDLVRDRLETTLGAVSTAPLMPGSPMGGIDEPQIGGVWPVANAWLTEAYAMRDPVEGWASFTKNTLATHAELFPWIWYGIWTGPDSYYGPDATRPGEADAHLATALTDYPALNAHVHTSPLRALYGLLGLRGTRDGFALEPRLPTEDYKVVMPRIGVRSHADRLEIRATVVSSAALDVRLLLPSGLRAAPFRVSVDGADVTPSVTRDGDVIVVPVAAAAEAPFVVIVGL